MRPNNNTAFDKAAFESGLKEWVDQEPAGSDENREEAARRISYCKNNGSGNSLYLNKLGLTSLTPEIGQLTHVKYLHIEDNSLATLPAEIGNLTDLKTLDLANNRINNLPGEIASLTKLQTLNVSNNQLENFPAGIGSLTNLNYVILRSNNLTTVPESLFQVSRLIEIENNNLTGEEVERLNQLAQNNNRVRVNFHCYPQKSQNTVSNPVAQQTIPEAIIARVSEETPQTEIAPREGALNIASVANNNSIDPNQQGTEGNFR